MSDDCERYVLVTCHRGAPAAEFAAERRWHPDRFELILMRAGPSGPRRNYSVWQRRGTSTAYRFVGSGRFLLVLEMRRVERLWWPQGAQIDSRDWYERRNARRG